MFFPQYVILKVSKNYKYQNLGSSSSEIVRVGEVGTFCDSDLRNLPCTAPNSFCINNICTCAPLYEQVNGECILKSSNIQCFFLILNFYKVDKSLLEDENFTNFFKITI